MPQRGVLRGLMPSNFSRERRRVADSWEVQYGTAATCTISNCVAFSNDATTGVWQSWNSAVTASTTFINQSTWNNWNQQAVENSYARQSYQQQMDHYQNQLGQMNSQLNGYGSAQQQQAPVEQPRPITQDIIRAGNERAKALLKSILTPAEWEQLERDSYLDLTVSGGGRPDRIYRVYRMGSMQGNIRLMRPARSPSVVDGLEAVEQWCVHPSQVPTDDGIAAQILHLRHDEDTMIRMANKTRLIAA